MNVNEAIDRAALHFYMDGNLHPSHCDVRCMINDLTADNPGICAKGYNQDRAHRDVCKRIDTARWMSGSWNPCDVGEVQA